MLKSSDEAVYKTVCMLCFQVCGINAYVKEGKLTKVEPMIEHPFSRGEWCPRGQNILSYVYSPDRIRYPLMKKNGKFMRTSWDEALNTIANKLKQIKKDYGARSLAVSVGSIGAENIGISAFAQRFRGAYGTPNYFSIEAHCFRTRIMARLLTFGTYPLEDPDNAECLILWGHNPDASEPPLAARINKALDRELRLFVIDPKRIPLAKKGKFIQIRPGTDAALALAMMNVIINEGIYNKEFVEKYTIGFDELRKHVQDYPPENVAAICGVKESDIREISRVFSKAKGASIIQGINSLDQHVNGFQNSRALAILHVITGNYNIPGGWCTNPFMRLTDLRIPVDEDPIGSDRFPLFHKLWNMVAPYGQQMVLPEAILDDKPYPIKAIIVSGGNPAASWPDSEKIKKAFSKLEMLVVMDLFKTQTTEIADIILPACTSLEMTALAYNYGLTGGMPFAMLSPKAIERQGESWPDWKFYTELGKKMGYGEYFPWNSDEEVVEHFLKGSLISFKDLKDHPEGVWFGERCYDMNNKQIRTPSGKIELYSQTLAEHGYDPLPVFKEPTQSSRQAPELVAEYPLVLNTGSRIIEYTHWQMRHLPELRKLAPDPVAEIHPDTATKYEIKDGDLITIETTKGKITINAKITEDLLPDVINVYHGWLKDQNQNVLTDLEPRDPITGYPELRALACRIKKV